MKVLYLGPDSPLVTYLQKQGEEVIRIEEKISPQDVVGTEADYLVSYGYRHIISEEILALFFRKAINLHISLLPWNRGADPNFWSWIEGTPKGVSIHYLDTGVDTGDVLGQKEIPESDFGENPTLASTYELLQREIQELFKEKWELLRIGRCHRKKQEGPWSFHLKKQKEKLEHLLTEGWDTPVSVLVEYGKSRRG